MNRLIEMSLSHRLVVLLLAALLAGLGWSALNQLPIDAFPDVTNIQVTVISQASTLSPIEVEQLVTYPIEQAYAGLPYSTEVRSLSKFGLSMVTVVFEDGTNIYFARQLVLERLFSVGGQLPEGVVSNLGPISTGLGEVFQYTLESPTRDLMELRTLQDWVLRPILRTVPGVAGVDSFGGEVRQFHVEADPAALRRHELTLAELAEAVAANNGVAGGSYVERGGEQYVVRGDGWVRGLEDLRNTVVAYRNRVPILLGQVAAVVVGPEIRQGAITRDGAGETVAGIVLMLRGASGKDVVAGVKEKLEVAQRSLPDDVTIVPFYDRSELVETALREKLKEIPGVEFGYTQPIQMRVDELLSGVKSQIAVKIFGDELPVLADFGNRVADILRGIKGAADVKVEAIEGLGYLQITMQRHRMARLGVNVAQVRELIETAIGGKVVTTVPEGDRRTDVVVRLPRSHSARVENLKDLPLMTPSGERVLLREVARIDLVAGPAQISREDGKRRVVVELNVVGRDIGTFVAEAQQLIVDEVELPTGYFVTWGGQFEQQQRAMARLKVMVPVALLLIFILLYINFRSTRPVWLILANIPLALVGGVFGLKLSGLYLSVSASVGFIALFGIAILNGLVMVEFFQNLEAEGMPRRDVVVSGVVTSTLLTLMVLPVLYNLFGKTPQSGEGDGCRIDGAQAV
jgi:Cu/Ag efflux pump CusA